MLRSTIAEAYEQAMEEAYLRSEKDRSEWKPRQCARTVLLIGDSMHTGGCEDRGCLSCSPTSSA